MIVSKEFEQKIQENWGNNKNKWTKDFKELLANIKGNKIMFNTYTPDFNDGDPCTTEYIFISGSTYLSENGYIYQILDTNEIVAAKVYSDSDDNLYDPPLSKSRIVSIKYLYDNNYIDEKVFNLFEDFKAKNTYYDSLPHSERESQEAYSSAIQAYDAVNLEIQLPLCIENFIKIHIEDICEPYSNHFGYFYLEDDTIKVNAKYIDISRFY